MSGINPMDLENPYTREEDEDVEEQKRREAELQDLLATGFQEFNYDNESTINSSSTSFEATSYNKTNLNNENEQIPRYRNIPTNSGDHAGLEDQYKATDNNQYEQLKILYEIRQREAKKLTEQLANYQIEKTKEMSGVKSKMILMEGEINQLKITNSNLENLLGQKTESLRSKHEEIMTKDAEIKNMKQKIAELNLVIGSYETTVNELQLKLHDNNPFSGGDRIENAQKIQKHHQEQQLKMETLLQDQTMKLENLQKENLKLKEEISKISENQKKNEDDNTYALMSLAKKLQHSQEQCKNLFALGEAIKKESDHFKERLRHIESKEDILNESINRNLDKESLLRQLEKLKRLLFDQNFEINTLQSKLKSYNTDLAELFQYRKILNDMSSNAIEHCNNSDHSDLLLFMQKQLQSYEQAIEDRNQQIISLNNLNKELHEKIEEMIEQTRNDIQNLSQKYSLPQLETMSNELKLAEDNIKELQEQLESKKELENENSKLKEELQMVSQNFESELQKLHDDLSISKEQLIRLQNLVENSQKSQLDLERNNSRLSEELQQNQLKLENSRQDMMKKIKNCLNSSKIQQKLLTLLNQLEKNEFSPRESSENELDETFRCKIETLTQELREANKIINELNGKHHILLEDADKNAELIRSLKDKIKLLDEQLNKAGEIPETNEEDQEDYLVKIEETYKKALKKKSEAHAKEKEQWQQQENAYRQNLVKVLQECGNQIKKLEEENNKLIAINRELATDFQTYKNSIENRGNIILKATHKQMLTNKKWSDLIQSTANSLTNLDRGCEMRLNNLSKKIKMKENEIRLLEEMHNEKVKNFKKVYRSMPS